MKIAQCLRPPSSDRHARKAATSSVTETSEDWQKHLPEAWLAAIEPPLYFRHYSEYEIFAERSVGYDADDCPCFTTHQFILTSMASDDDEEFYEVVTYAEEMSAWRLRDERWLIFRTITTSTCNAPRGFYAVSPDMPR
uniref:Uncharacterized protein n=1 Tax=Dechloromonas aromatica (strain RCB) TaxID=159087 RepID=Q47G01_DECAR